MRHDPAQPSAAKQAPRSTRQVSRPERTGKMLDFEEARRDRALTQQQAADDLGVPRTTLLGWTARAAATALTPAQRKHPAKAISYALRPVRMVRPGGPPCRCSPPRDPSACRSYARGRRDLLGVAAGEPAERARWRAR